MTYTAMDYMREVSGVLGQGYSEDCVAHACRLAELLLAEGELPWIGRLRDVTQQPYGRFHGPLTPKQLSGRNAQTWTTHYVACAGGRVYDPLAGAPAGLADYSMSVFGRDIPMETFLDANATAHLCRIGELRAAFRGSR